MCWRCWTQRSDVPDTKILHFFAVILLLGWVLVMLNTEIRRAWHKEIALFCCNTVTGLGVGDAEYRDQTCLTQGDCTFCCNTVTGQAVGDAEHKETDQTCWTQEDCTFCSNTNSVTGLCRWCWTQIYSTCLTQGDCTFCINSVTGLCKSCWTQRDSLHMPNTRRLHFLQ